MGGAALLPPFGSHCIVGETRFDLACQYCGLDGSTEVGRWCFSAIWIVKPDHSAFQISLMADRDP